MTAPDPTAARSADAQAAVMVVGAAVAGGARAWTGRARHRRAALRTTHPGALS